jgi:small-conductance mechanosensitive channel
VQQISLELKQEVVARAAPRVYFSREDLEEQSGQIDKQEEAANAELAAAQSRRLAEEERVRETQQQLEAAASEDPQLTEKLAARRRALERWSDEIDLITQQLRRLAPMRLAWGRRFSIAAAERGSSEALTIDDVKTWQKEARAELDELASDASARIHRMADLRSQLAAIADRTTPDSDAAVVGFINAQRIQLDEMLRSQQASLMQIESSRRVYAKLLDELGANALSAERLAAGAIAQVTSIWKAELFAIGDGADRRYITVQRAVIGVSVLIVGWTLSHLLSGVFTNRLLKRFRLSKDASATLGYVAHYTTLFLVLLIALKTINVPLTAFTILGGALAIGVGFGSQALINNFIGGLIMLAERPVRLGERIMFGKLDGVVEEVGFRCTKLRTSADHLVTVPNSNLVNESIENVGRRRTIRRQFNLAIAYDTPREKVGQVVRAIRELLNEKGIRERIHPIVGFEEFPPRVYFSDYNSDSLNISVLYWYAPPEWWEFMEHSERVNFRIMEEFERLEVDFALTSKTMYIASEPRREESIQLKPVERPKTRSQRDVA